jgi:hypothetical protein
VDEYDLIYLSDSSVYNLNNDPSEYTEDDDLSGPVANEIYHLAVNTDSASAVYKPVIVDAGILNSGNVSQDTNIYKLAKLLLGADLDGDNASYDEDSDTWNISEEEYQAFADADGDGYFVHCNIFSVPADGAQVGTGNGTFSLLEDLAVPFVEVNEASRSEYENFSSESEDSFDAQASKLGFREVSANICLENFVRESENISKSDDSQKYKFFNLSISKAICMEYIICYASKRETSETDIIKVLDIEPCTISSVDKVDNTGNIISESTQTQIENQVKELLGIKDDGIDDDQQISFTHMTSAELIGKVEDLCKYDLIYMGLCTDSMNITKVTHYYLKSDTAHEKPVDISSVKGDWTKNYDKVEETVTNYNDSKMKGLVYSNIGDLKKAKCFAGVLDTDYNYNYYYGAYGRYFKQANNIWYTGNGINESSYSTTRYSGNDLTKEKLNDLIDYVKSAAPVILADDFLVVQSDGTKKVNDIRTVYKEVKAANGTITLEAEDENTENGLIDNCSRMYELIDEIAASKTYKNVKTCTEWESNQTLLNQYITLGKPKLEVTEQAKVTDEEYVQIDGDTIAIDFSVKTYASTDTKTPFNVDLFIDFNADGRYSKTTEKIDVNAYNIYLVDDEKNTKELQNVTSMEEDGVVSECHSVAPLNGESDSVHYRLEYSVSKDYLGVYPVKLVVEQQDNLYRYAYWQGYFYHSKTSGSATQDVYVLQILPSSVTVSNYYNCALFDMDLTGKYSDGAASDDAVYSGYYKDKYKTHNAESYYTFADVDTSLNKELYTQDYWDGKGENLSADQLNERRWNMLTDTFEHSTFYKYIYGTVEEGCKLSGYTMHIDSIFGDTLVDKFTNADGSFNQTGYQSYLDHFDMLVLGFGDSVTYFGEDTIAGLVDNYYVGIHNYIESGKSVLFTHDTTSYNASTWMSNEYKNTWENGHMSDLLAGDVGFDRYGVYNNDDSLLSLALSVGIDDLTEGDEEKIKVSEYPSLVSAMKKIEESASLQDTYLLKGTETEITKGKLYDIIVGEAASENKDIAYEPNSGKKTLTYEVQGRSTIALNKDGSSISGYNLINLVHDKSIFNDNKTVVQQWGVARTTSAELLNEGQILVYPYNILDQLDENGIMQIAKTHYQYFQIDMNADDDNDGESDITVWLSLTDSIDNTIEYDTAKRDARNNYYIYTKGNVTYSGVGHSRINTIGNDVEVQLYINTIIASYQASSQKPEVSFKESADLGSADMDTIYVSLDSTISVDDSTSIGTVIEGVNSLDDVTAPSEYKTVDGDDGKAYYWKADANMKNGVVDSDSYEAAYIYVQDTNTVRGTEKDITLSYYLIVDSPSDVPEKLSKLGLSVVNLKTLMKESEDVYAIPLDLQTYTMLYDKNGTLAPQSFDELNDTAVSGKTYRVDIPYYLLAEDQKRVEIRCYATTTIKKEDAVISTLRNCDSIYLQRISLFDLD